jgi:transposase
MSAVPRPPEELPTQTPPAVLAYLQALEARLVEQDARIVVLEARLRQDSSTSSRPPSSDPQGTRAQRRAPTPPAGRTGERRRRGGQPGHPGHHRSLVHHSGSIGWWSSRCRRVGAGGPRWA